MDLKTFVKNTLLELDKALSEASKEFPTHNYKFGKNASWNNSIDFEVQIYASESTWTWWNIDAWINVAWIKLWVWTKWETNKDSHELSKISFSIIRENSWEQELKEYEERKKFSKNKTWVVGTDIDTLI